MNVTAINAIAKPMNKDDIRKEGLVPSVNMDVNCKIGIYINANTTNLNISNTILALPFIQLLSKDPIMIIPMPISKRVIVP